MKNDLPQVKEALDLLVYQLKNAPEVEYIPPQELDFERVILDKSFIIRSAPTMVETFSGPITVPGFEVVMVIYIPSWFDYSAGVGGPEELEEEEIGKTQSAIEAAQIAFKLYIENMSENILRAHREAQSYLEEDAMLKKMDETEQD